MTRFVFLTKTRWDEPPRIRHQMAHLLAAAGHQVLFFEKPALPGQGVSPTRPAVEGITLSSHRELVHHKLRLLPPVHWINAAVTCRSLRTAVQSAGFDEDAIIVNFNYDYYFVRAAFLRQRVITMINDDFVSTALFGFKAPLRWALRRTCASSDRVITVSEPLQRQLAPFCRPELFLPWADRPYQPPAPGARDALLFWGFINKKLDLARVAQMADELAARRPHIRILMVGPVEQGIDAGLAALGTRANVQVLPPTPLEKLPLDRVIASIIPYAKNMPDVEAIALPNKALQLLARGLPLMISGMPYFVRQPFVFRMDDAPVTQLVDEIESRFADLQPDMQAFVAGHSAEARLEQFMRLAA